MCTFELCVMSPARVRELLSLLHVLKRLGWHLWTLLLIDQIFMSSVYEEKSAMDLKTTQLPHPLHSNMGSSGRVEGAFLEAEEERPDHRCKG